MIKTPIYELNQPQGNDVVDIEVLNENIKKIDDILSFKIDNSKKSDSVTMDSSDSVATSKAVKAAYDKSVEALGKSSRNETQLAEGANNEVVKQKRLVLKTDTRSTDLVYTSGNLTGVLEKDGTTTIKTSTLTYDIYGVLQTIAETAGGTTATTTLNRTNGKLTGFTRAVV